VNDNVQCDDDDYSALETSTWYNRSASPILEMARLFSALIKAGQRTIAFCGTRKLVELVFDYSVKLLTHDSRQDLLPLITSYRGGYTSQERRSIETDLFQNKLLGVAATCALELGIDVGSLDVTLHLGFPGTFSSLWQQAGRAGRSGRPALSIIVCFQSLLDQHFARHPLDLLQSNVERAILDINNIHVLKGHLCCAAKEIPLNVDFFGGLSNGQQITDQLIWGDRYGEILQILIDLQKVRAVRLPSHMANSTSHLKMLWRFWSDGSYSKNEASKDVSLRMIDPLTITLLDNSRNEILDTVEYSRAFYELFEGAIVLHRGQQFLVTKLDLSANSAHARPCRVNYFTTSQNETQVNVVKRIENDGWFYYGVVQVVSKVTGFYKKRMGSGEIFETGTCSLPPLEYETTAIWIDISVELKQELEKIGFPCAESLHSCNHVLYGLAPWMGQCDPGDLGTEHGLFGEIYTHPMRLMLFDKRPGGLGSCSALYTFRVQLIHKAVEHLQNCPCFNGCPSCMLEKRYV
jgi:DEAD/DEAH box helicase domain-containing protein